MEGCSHRSSDRTQQPHSNATCGRLLTEPTECRSHQHRSRLFRRSQGTPKMTAALVADAYSAPIAFVPCSEMQRIQYGLARENDVYKLVSRRTDDKRSWYTTKNNLRCSLTYNKRARGVSCPACDSHLSAQYHARDTHLEVTVVKIHHASISICTQHSLSSTGIFVLVWP